MLQSHYRSPVDYSDSSLNEARSGLIRCYTTLRQLQDMQSGSINSPTTPLRDKSPAGHEDYLSKLRELVEKFDAALDDDFNTAQGLGYVFDAVRLTNNYIAAEKNRIAAGHAADVLDCAGKAFDHFGAILGILRDDPNSFFAADKEIESRKRKLDTAEIESLIQAREKARAAKDWVKADEIRNKLAELHVVLKDSKEGTTWLVE